jgi:hypothetical protein
MRNGPEAEPSPSDPRIAAADRDPKRGGSKFPFGI